uniref:NADH-ubiquinone oxidoreductase chain 3 n=1 Tax=Styela clava TaxID=7725 RepID=A0A024HW87_STYCL|nr:NADH dehydrogenase subunit 3 [Styela clava]CDM98928.1 NADH dehydrogenase subunit 3 [Styela clava]
MFWVIILFFITFLLGNFYLLVGTGIVFLLYYFGNKSLLAPKEDVLVFNKELVYYECGFELYYFKYGFSLQYFIIGLSFMLFDLEICLFLPVIFAVALSGASVYVSVLFIMILLLIFIYELYLGVVGW